MNKKCMHPVQSKRVTGSQESPDALLSLMERAEKFAGVGSWMSTRKTGNLHFSGGLLQLLELTSDQHGHEFSQLFKRVHEDDRERVKQCYSAIDNGEGHDIEYRIHRSDGSIINVHDRCEQQQDSDGNIIRTIGFLKNISKIKRQKEELRKCRREMDEFAQTTSHDLQESLRAINNFNRLLQMKYAEQLDEKGRDFINRSLDAGNRLAAQIDNLLMLARIKTRGKGFTPVDLNTLLVEAQSKLQPLIESRDAEIKANQLPTLNVDAEQIGILFYHLLANGLYYNSSNRPHIVVDYSRMGACHRISIRDNGIGIDKQFHQRIFVVFQRLHTQNEFKGEGMGLTIAKHIVERHGGSIWVESEPGNGATFHFILPGETAGHEISCGLSQS